MPKGERRRRKNNNVSSSEDEDDEHDEKEVKRGRDRDREKETSSSKRRKHSSLHRRRHRDDDDNDDDDDHQRRKRRRRRREEKERKKKHHRKKKPSRYSSSDNGGSSDGEGSSDSSASASSASSSDSRQAAKTKKKKVVNTRLLEKLSARGETLEEREERRAKRRAARITSAFGYTLEDNPWNDTGLHETFSWRKKEEKEASNSTTTSKEAAEKKSRADKQDKIFEEIEKVRKRREDRELQFEEMERIKAEESRMKELENYDEWARKEEEFHLQQQRQRSAIRLVEGREKPVDVLAKNLLLFGLSEEDKKNRAAVKYQERYSALEELENLEAELEEPHAFLKVLKINELEELLVDIEAFRTLEREALSGAKLAGGGSGALDDNPLMRYWDALHVVTKDEIEYLKTGGSGGTHATIVKDILKLFEGQPMDALEKMKQDVVDKLHRGRAKAMMDSNGVVDTDYWQLVHDQLLVHLAKMELSELHSKMLVRQLERLEKRKAELLDSSATGEAGKRSQEGRAGVDLQSRDAEERKERNVPEGVDIELGNLEEELGLTNEVELAGGTYAWNDKYRPRKPRYFNRVKTGYDWNKYNQTHYDHDNPPPKIVQGYKFNIFYPDLIDKTKTPQFFLEAADSDEFCIIRFHAGPPYEDIAFKIINREWNRSRKRGFRCTFDRGVLSLYFNFATHWYRR